ncbi:rhomboid family intramembrane serine protease [Pseudalkalibacillus hwajinpoensis]|uniref:Rhomboid family intramembrane serine protease n=1 Tax=Guptibacillus hwajinpoensis TaxID=208199 RepID=A0A4U1MG64_9BACL|nr:rhomboid family intramembrane serine protease [Pseudalkalibacillus hwajinpoensis]TKD69382.1 rhomboid family intramembrane serine protease [Pseudalkalibacillus hwajinpoensis]
MSITNTPLVTLTIFIMYIIIFVIDKILNSKLSNWGTGKSFDYMGKGEWYRLITAPFFHMNLVHMMGNAFGIYFVGLVLENKIGSSMFLLIYLVGNLFVSVLFSNFFSFSKGTGASPGIFALIGCLVYLFTQTPELFDFQLGTWKTNYILLYSILGNFIGRGGAFSHLLGFIFGVMISLFLQ